MTGSTPSGMISLLAVFVVVSLAVIVALSAMTFHKVQRIDDNLTTTPNNDRTNNERLIPCDPSKADSTITTINGKTMEEFTRRNDGKYAITSKYVRILGGWLDLNNDTLMANYTNDDGIIVSTYKGTREAMTCMAIHIHPLGGQTCVLEGAAATIFVEGIDEPQIYKAGECYYMPPNKYMTSCNLEDTDSIELDVLLKRKDGVDTIVCEPGWDDVCVGRKCWINNETEKTEALIVDKMQEIAVHQEKLANSEVDLADLQP